MCILHIVFCTVCKYVLSICKLFFLHCLSICKLFVVFLHCLEHARKNFTHQDTWCDNKSDLIWFDFDLIWQHHLIKVLYSIFKIALTVVPLYDHKPMNHLAQFLFRVYSYLITFFLFTFLPYNVYLINIYCICTVIVHQYRSIPCICIPTVRDPDSSLILYMTCYSDRPFISCRSSNR